MNIILAYSVLWALSTGEGNSTATPSVRAEAVRFLGDGFFEAELSIPEPTNSAFLPAEGVPCPVLAGPVGDVYFLPFGEDLARRASNPALESIDYEELGRLQQEYSQVSQRLASLRSKQQGYQLVLEETDLPEPPRAQVSAKLDSLRLELETVSEQALKIQEAMQEQYARNARNSQRSAPSWRPLLVGRVYGTGKAEISLDGTIWGSERASRVPLSLPADLTKVEEVPSFVHAWAAVHLAEVNRQSDEPGFSEFLSEAFARRFEPGRAEPSVAERRWGTNVSLYDLFTGGAAVRESMQLDRMVESVLTDPRPIAITEVQPLTLQDHPFEKMRGGRPFAGSELARVCPSDTLYLRFRSLKEWFRIEDLFNRWGGSFLSTVRVSGTDHDTMGRYREELALGNEALARLLGTRLIGEFAVFASDPLFLEGTALAVVFAAQEGKDTPFRTMFQAQRQLAANADGMQQKQIDLGGISVDWIGDTGGRVNTYHCNLRGNEVFCNSLDLLRRIVATSQGQSPSLHSTADYRYYRALYPRGENESAFLFLSQDWFRKITGPSWRIAHGRRRAAAEVLRDVHFAWQSSPPDRGSPDLAALLSGRWIGAESTAALDVRLDPATGQVACADFGSLDRLRPIDSMLPERVSAREKELYDAFRDDYRRYWRQFIDPVGVQIAVTEDQLEVDTLILPLIENSIYQSLRMISGNPSDEGSKAVPLPADALGALTLRWSPREAEIGELLREIATQRAHGQTEFDASWFGPSLTLGVADGRMMFTGASEGVGGWLGLRTGLDPSISLVATAILSALTLPTFAAVEVHDARSLEQFLDSIWQQASGARSRFDWDGVQVQPYTTPGEPRIHTVTFTLWVLDLRLHYAFVGPWLLLSNQSHLLESWIAQVGDSQGTDFAANGRLNIRPPSFQEAAGALGIAWQERIAGACRTNLAPLQRAADRGWFERAEQFLGYRAVCPEGGTYERDAQQVRCSVHGTSHAPTQPLTPPDTAPAVQLVRDIAGLTVEFSFTGDGLRSRLSARFGSDK